MGAILGQLGTAAEEYISARAEFEKAKTNFEAARDKLSAIKRIAVDVLDRHQWYMWQAENESVKYAGLSIGDAIRDALWENAYDAAIQVHNKQTTKYSPSLHIDQIEEALEDGGFEFRGTPKREIHAACIRLDGVEKIGESSRFRLTDYLNILEQIAGKEAVEATFLGIDAPLVGTEQENDVPF
jgi:hypothetical protein